MRFISYVLNPQKLARLTQPHLQRHQILQYLLEMVDLIAKVSQRAADKQNKNFVLSNRGLPLLLQKVHVRPSYLQGLSAEQKWLSKTFSIRLWKWFYSSFLQCGAATPHDLVVKIASIGWGDCHIPAKPSISVYRNGRIEILPIYGNGND